MGRKTTYLNILVATFWLVAAWPLLVWAWQTLSHEQHRMSLVLLVLMTVVAIRRIRDVTWSRLVTVAPRTTIFSATLMLLGASVFLIGENFLDIDILSSLGFVISIVGVLHAYLPRPYWLRSLLPLFLFVGVLPFQFHLEAYVGFPLRAGIAKIVGLMLGVETNAMSTVLAMENRVAAVDLPCSGLKSLWVGILFFLASTLFMNVHLTWRWLATIVISVFALIAANFARVFILSHLVLTFGPQEWLNIIHVPLGMVAFVMVCALFIMLLRRLQTHTNEDVVPTRRGKGGSALVLLAIPMMITILHAPFTKKYTEPRQLMLPMLSELTQSRQDLTAAEQDLFSRFDAAQVGKYRVSYETIDGSLLVSRSQHWRAHHNPEQCFRGSGLNVKTTQPFMVGQEPVRGVVGQDDKLIGLYWFQARGRFTDDFSERIYASLWEGEQDWILVSMLFAEPVAMNEDLHEFITKTRSSLTTWMNDTGNQI